MRVTRWYLHRPPAPGPQSRIDCLVELASLRDVLRWAHEDLSRGKMPRADRGGGVVSALPSPRVWRVGVPDGD